MTYTIEIKDGHHVVDMETTIEMDEGMFLRILKLASGYSAAEAFVEEFNKDFMEEFNKDFMKYGILRGRTSEWN